MQTELKTETRLEEHRKMFKFNEYKGSLLRIEDLSQDERDLVNTEFMNQCKGAENIDALYKVYVKVLHSWGIMCPHPQRQRFYDNIGTSDIPISFETSKWFECKACNTSVINR